VEGARGLKGVREWTIRAICFPASGIYFLSSDLCFQPSDIRLRAVVYLVLVADYLILDSKMKKNVAADNFICY
jgi:hypothetical protein